LFFIVILLVPLVVGHSPLVVRDNESIDSATIIPDASKSWALYAELSSDCHLQDNSAPKPKNLGYIPYRDLLLIQG